MGGNKRSKKIASEEEEEELEITPIPEAYSDKDNIGKKKKKNQFTPCASDASEGIWRLK